MKRIAILILVAMVGASQATHAALFDRGNGLIYDDFLDVTWLQDANLGAGSVYDPSPGAESFGAWTNDHSTDGLMTHANALAWALNLVFEGYTDWRLPRGVYYPEACFDNPDPSCPRNEMAHMFHHNLDGAGPGDPPDGFQDGVFHAGDVEFYYINWGSWNMEGGAFCFHYSYPGQEGICLDGAIYGAWAVRDGDVLAQVSSPPSTWLLLLGFIPAIATRATRAPYHRTQRSAA